MTDDRFAATIFGVAAFVICIMVTVAGCTGMLKRYDPKTVEQISHTIDFETNDYALTLTALEDGVLDEVERRSLELRHDTEMERLAAWIAAEAAKEIR